MPSSLRGCMKSVAGRLLPIWHCDRNPSSFYKHARTNVVKGLMFLCEILLLINCFYVFNLSLCVCVHV